SGGAVFPCWSADSRRAAFWKGGKLWRIEPGKGAPEPICDSQEPVRGGAWNRDNVILFSEIGKPLQRVPAAGGTPVTVLPFDTSPEENEQNFSSFPRSSDPFIYSNLAPPPGII